MKPIKIFIFFVSVLLFIGFLYLFFPEEGIWVKSFHFEFPTYHDANKETPKYADISEIISQNVIDEENEEYNNDTATYALSYQDTANSDSEKSVEINFIKDTVRANRETLKNKVHRLEFPEKNKKILYPFLQLLSDIKKSKKKQARIMHYGDSQIECDRITSYVRNKLQKQFGGYGPGMLNMMEPYYEQSLIRQENTGKWHRYTVFGNRDTNVLHNRYGIMGNFCSFTPAYNYKSLKNYNVSVTFSESYLAYKTARYFTDCKIFAGYNEKPVMYEAYIGDSIIDADFISPRNTIYTLKWQFEQPVKTVKFQFSGEHSPEFYGITLNSNYGVVMDNIPLRGSSGLIFTKMNKQVMRAIFKELKPSLIILQFGGNMVPYLTKRFKFYENRFYNQIKLINELLPTTPVIVIGVSDMSVKEGEYYVTPSNLEGIRDAMKSAAFRAGAVYWDLYEAMGGKNSMPSWVFAQPSLASTDFVHFNAQGARIVAEMFYNALIYEYNEYERLK